MDETRNYKKPLLIAPAGNLDKLKIAVDYGADAVYAGGKEFNLRSGSANFTLDEIGEGVEYAHQKGKYFYVALNIFAHNYHLTQVEHYLNSLAKYPIDALIVSDPGIIVLVKQLLPEVPIHLSTQANCTNYQSANFWHHQGVKRVVLARELSLDEIVQINANSDCETEVFIHGAMCISYSGRCYLSSYMADRGANLGDCAQSCRWKYAIVEEKRPGEYFEVYEDNGFTSVMSSRDLCMIQHMPELLKAGINAFKIEGRMKSQYYVAAVTRIYREAIDCLCSHGAYEYQSQWLEELGKISHRKYCTGFFLGNPSKNGQVVESENGYAQPYKFLGLFENHKNGNYARVLAKNKIEIGDEIEIMGKQMNQDFTQTVKEIFDQEMKPIQKANPGQRVFIAPIKSIEKDFMIRKKIEEE
ncbi:MAG: U32 family peptidase [Candidatus Scalindua sp. AMX11]|nr:MAG: U32 family peptidase [Candidatus Scalindua sp.]NOG83346.1 U32 family peptidase [Planctomycetota bacterium]RZV76752.1 MAG: U32 family peptidase [Candidatus Scalindua sp. SCAELEC01]TDE63936.1 MAG: U32 family peptidase [Candidatus Scalindua sp. AMX11]GJQ60264.1 MAG: peptidase U32 [Candidatus Scalindua sp.]